MIRLTIFTITCLFVLTNCNPKQKHSTDFTAEYVFTKGIEGPAVNANGDLFAVNFEEEGTIGIVDQNGKGKIYLTLPEGSIGNGIRFDTHGNMFIADYKGHKVYRVKKGSKTPEVWAQDSILNQPNDLAIAPNNTIYLSDPNWKEGSGRIWMVDQNRKIQLLEDNMGTTNGIEVSPDGRKLYVNESVQRKVWEYDIKEDGTIHQKKEFLAFDDFGMDGMRCDIKGNLYITRYDKGSVVVVDKSGKIISEIQLKGKKPSNIAFGGQDGKTCFVTMADRGSIETFRAEYPGRSFNKNE
ncbi:SMP-30/gluconolactonase/LRE family protein [Arenibacter certesii]|uniref:Gluconolactonase n=1 Tax=Arenibacter certesii TaxID=228955 RepID=A0A918MPS8_9FLAO|nr:SMP-30/gluconolactonase/LRE family protein [Arenibacter certesii]GGW43785.1 gluconolactonase [Arenibacter certesii]